MLLVLFLVVFVRFCVSRQYDVRLRTRSATQSGSSGTFYIGVYGTSGLWTDFATFINEFDDEGVWFNLKDIGNNEWDNLLDVGEIERVRLVFYGTDSLKLRSVRAMVDGVLEEYEIGADQWTINNQQAGKCDEIIWDFADSPFTYVLQGGETTSACPITGSPTLRPTDSPTITPTYNPTTNPTMNPTVNPTYMPTNMPTTIPTNMPSSNPTPRPTDNPTFTYSPTLNPTALTMQPTTQPTDEPTDTPVVPTDGPTTSPVANAGSGNSSGGKSFAQTVESNDTLLWVIIALLISLFICIFLFILYYCYPQNKNKDVVVQQNPSKLELAVTVNSKSQDNLNKDEEKDDMDGILGTLPNGPEGNEITGNNPNIVPVEQVYKNGGQEVPMSIQQNPQFISKTTASSITNNGTTQSGNDNDIPLNEINNMIGNQKPIVNRSSINQNEDQLEIPSDDEKESDIDIDIIDDGVEDNTFGGTSSGLTNAPNRSVLDVFTGDYANRKLELWTLEDVRSFLKDQKLSKEYSYQFGLKGIDGKILSQCTGPSQLESIGVSKLHSHMMYRELQYFRNGKQENKQPQGPMVFNTPGFLQEVDDFNTKPDPNFNQYLNTNDNQPQKFSV